jgi:hypothetical protein
MGGKPKAPPAPPPAPAPVRADSAMGEQAYSSAARRDGLRKTVNPTDPLAPTTALGSFGKLGMGGEGVMVNNAPPPNQSYTGNNRMGNAIYTAMGGAAGGAAMSKIGSKKSRSILGGGIFGL